MHDTFCSLHQKKKRIILNKDEVRIQKLQDEGIVDDQSYNLHWSSIKNEKNNLSLSYAGKKIYLLNFLVLQEDLN